MTKEEKNQYLSFALAFKRKTLESAQTGQGINEESLAFFSSLPKLLFKYRRFDKFTIDMIENKYLYLCPAEKLDDPFECLVDLDISRFYDENRKSISAACYQMIVEMTLSFAPEQERERLRELIYSCTTPQYTLNRRKALDIFHEVQGSMPGVDVPMIINNIGNFPNVINGPEVQEKIGNLISFSVNAKKEVGICSLSENKRSQVMWAMYADNYSGYCVEYDFEHSIEAAIDTYPVIYDNGRKNNVVTAVISMFLDGMVERITGGKMTTDQTQYFRMFLTKSDEWAFQDEWRIVREAGVKVPAPPIKAIYVGHKADPENQKMILGLSERFGFKVFKTRIDHKTLKIEFDELKL